MRTALSVCLLVLASAASAEADYARVVYYRPVYVYDPCVYHASYGPWHSWYYSAPVFVTEGALPSQVSPQPSIRQYAPQTPAPPSPEQILTPPREKPQVRESRSAQPPPVSAKFYDSYYVAGIAANQHAMCSVAFWNLADKPVQLHIGGQTHTVPRQQAVTLNLPRQFQWQIDQREPEPAQVAQDQGAMEIVIRR